MFDLSIITTWFQNNAMDILIKLVSVGVVWIVARIFTKKFDKIVVSKFWPFLKKLGMTRRKFNLVDDIADIIVYIIAVMLTLYIFDLTGIIYTALTAAGVIGLVIGFAVKEIASNLISGILIKLNQPFIEGDVISIDEKYRGTVTKVSLYYTDLVDYQGIATSLPNAFVISKALTNYSKQTERLIVINVVIASDSDSDKALDVLKKIAECEENRIVDRGVDVFTNDIKEYNVELSLRFWVDVSKYYSTKRKIVAEISKQFKKNKIQLAVPVRKNI